MGSTIYVFNLKFFLFFIPFSHLMISASSLCLDHERSALWEFKNSLSNSMSASTGLSARPKMASWNLGGGENASECCSWDGVECHQKTGHVIGLDLGSSFLYGSINSTSTLFSLVQLQSLNLADNNFNYSKIPSEISRLSRLSRLNLSASVFSGQIPFELLGLSRLVSLDLAVNLDPWSSDGLFRLIKPNLDSVVHNLTNLQELYLGNVFINSTVPVTLANMTSLTDLSLHDCQLHGEFPWNIFLLPSLQILYLYNNKNLNGSLPEFPQRSSMTQLDISKTSFSGRIPDSIGNLTNLNYLSVSFTYVDGDRLLWFRKLTELTGLLIDSINLKAMPLPSSLANLTHLNQLCLNSNNFIGPLPSWLMNLTQLTFLDISGNNLQGPIPSSLANLMSLEFLNLHANNFSGIVEANIFFSLKNLTQLHLSSNHLSFLTNNITLSSVPKFVLLGLGSCNLREFPKFLRFQNDLQVLSLTQNMIREIPEWMWNTSNESLDPSSGSVGYPIIPWASLRILDLTYNLIEGPIPVPPPTTSFYYVSNNRFKGEIPATICNLGTLSIFDLSNNNLSGTIPQCLGNLSSSLTVLNLKVNNFRGTIPNMYTKECRLRMINLSQNQLEGQIPSSLTNCTALEILDLGNNHLKDTFPFWLGALEKLQVLVLTSNRFHGEIQSPKTPSTQFPKLRIIDLSNNVLTGNWPVEYFQQWNAMKIPLVDPLVYLQLISYLAAIKVLGVTWQGRYLYSTTIANKGVRTEYVKILDILIAIDFSNNKLKGEIPKSVGILKGIQSLNLSNNELSGQIPPSIGNLTMLESLDLSQNKLSGQIPVEFAQLSFLAFFNVSFNNLKGPLPQGKQFNTFLNNSYVGNLALCGEPLSLGCGNSKAPLPSTPEENDDSEFPSRTDWIVMSIALGGGLIVGLTFGQTLTTKNHDWFVDIFGKRPRNWQSIAMLGRERRTLNRENFAAALDMWDLITSLFERWEVKFYWTISGARRVIINLDHASYKMRNVVISEQL